MRIVPRLRNAKSALDPRAKTGNYLNNMLGLIEAKREGDDDALFLNAAPLQRLSIRPRTLEDLFLELTGKELRG